MSNARNFRINDGFILEEGISALVVDIQEDFYSRHVFVNDFLTDCIVIGADHYANFGDADYACLLITGDESSWPHIKEVLQRAS